MEHVPAPRGSPFRTKTGARLRGCGLAIASVLHARAAPLPLWLALAASVLVWPQAAYWLGRRSADPHRTERRSLTFDSILGGAWVALMEFNLLPSAVIAAMLSMDKVAVGGAGFLARCTAAFAAGCLLVWAATGFPMAPHTTMAQIAASLPLLVFYPVVVGVTNYRLARRVHDQNQMLSELSRTDGLSRLLNRRYWEEATAAQFRRCRDEGAAASLLMLDVDHFKAINDRHGHPAGDEVIRSVARILRE